MTFTEQQQKGQEILNTIIKKSWEDEGFKQELIASPKAVFENEIGKPIEDATNIVVEDQTNSEFVYLNIPRKIDLDNLQLTEEQLGQIAGGITPTFIAVGYGIMAGVAIYAAAK